MASRQTYQRWEKRIKGEERTGFVKPFWPTFHGNLVAIFPPPPSPLLLFIFPSQQISYRKYYSKQLNSYFLHRLTIFLPLVLERFPPTTRVSPVPLGALQVLDILIEDLFPSGDKRACRMKVHIYNRNILLKVFIDRLYNFFFFGN